MTDILAGKTILQVIPTLNSGGAERSTVDMAIAIQKVGGRAIVVSSGGRLVEILQKNGILHVSLPVDRKNPFIMVKNAFLLRALVKREKVDLTHVRSRAPAWSVFLARISFITTYHGLYKSQNAFKRFYNSVMTKGIITIANSAHTNAHIQAEHGAVKTVIIDRGVNLAVFDPTVTPADRRFGNGFVVFMPARINKGKGHKIAIEALAIINNPAISLVFAGDGDDTELREFANEKGVSVHFAGHIADMAGAILSCDLVIAPTTVPESFGRVPLEAGAMGKPVIVSDLGGLRYTVIDRVTGWLSPAGDATTLAALISYVEKLPLEIRENIGAVARAHILANFGLNLMIDRTIQVYSQITQKND